MDRAARTETREDLFATSSVPVLAPGIGRTFSDEVDSKEKDYYKGKEGDQTKVTVSEAVEMGDEDAKRSSSLDAESTDVIVRGAEEIAGVIVEYVPAQL